MPVSTRASARANKGQTSRYDDFVQQITLAPGRYAYNGSNLYKLEDTSINNHQVWAPDTACVQALACEMYQTHWVPDYWATDVVTKQLHQQGNMMIYQNSNSGFLNNDVYGSYEAFSP